MKNIIARTTNTNFDLRIIINESWNKGINTN